MSTTTEHYRADGVRITHDPNGPGMAEQYGKPGQTDSEGFDPYADTVGAGIYGGNIKRDADGRPRSHRTHDAGPMSTLAVADMVCM